MKYSFLGNKIFPNKLLTATRRVWRSGRPLFVGRTQITGLILIFCTCLGARVLAQSFDLKVPAGGKVSAGVIHGLESGSVEAIVLMRSQADVGFAARLRGKEAKGAFVFAHLQAHAHRAQAALMEQLKRKNIPYRPLFIVNAIYLPSLNAGDCAWIASRQDVAAILPNPVVGVPPLVEDASLSLRQGVEWGLAKIEAPAVWAMGFKGQGVVIGGQDTGFDWRHPTMMRQYKGWLRDTLAEHNYHWHDAISALSPLNKEGVNPCGLRLSVPCDDNAHGTHTMGTMVGDDGQGNQIGVAPDARWIGCRNMERGYGSPFTYLECFQWFLAPFDLNGSRPDPARAPDVINNSWYCATEEGCNPSNYVLLELAVNNLRAAGVFVVISAGNAGSGCQTITNPPAIVPAGFAVGASQANDSIAGFSSRGPVSYDNRVFVKPDVVAPGVGVRSAIPGLKYATLSGTSMAGPHVAGTVALMISANPSLRGEVGLLEDILEKTAQPLRSPLDCGGIAGSAIPNPVYGFGRINALAAVKAAIQQVTSTPARLEDEGFRVFPNPAQGQIALELKERNMPAGFTLLDAWGRPVFQRTVHPGDGTLVILDLSGLPPGFYCYRFLGASGKLVLH